MSTVRDFFVGLPLACGVEPNIAEVYGKHLGELFDYEIAHPYGVFSRDKLANTAKRMSYAFHGWPDFADPKKIGYALRLALFMANSYGKNAKGIDSPDLDFTKAILLNDEPYNPEVASLMSVEQASTMSNWA